MTIEETLLSRSQSACELCSATDNLSAYTVTPKEADHSDNCTLLCSVCQVQIDGTAELDQNHWRTLSDSMWSPTPAVQVMAWRMLKRLSVEPWAQDLLDMLYLDEELLAWAQAGISSNEATEPTLDSNGTVLVAGDNVTIIKDLQVKGANFTAKRGTAVRNISLTNNPEHIEGRVNGTRIVLLSCYLKKS